MRADPALTWYALAVTATRELAVAKDLRGTALTILIPMETNWHRVSRHANRMELVERPLLPAYIFAGCRGAFPFRALDETRLYCEPVRHARELAVIPANQIQEVLDLAEQIKPLARPGQQSFQVGMSVQFAHGPFTGQHAVVAAVLKQKVKIIHQFLGSSREITVKSTELKTLPQEKLAVNANHA
jgi:transcription antitermination factor NusG